ncbi:SDR family oxidoreductase [uncultured Dokdonia sp.]|uniref:SDR family NAD(P)-dependent oxidoreductase n=1 Tax=uncultured Dokdonia sp. TaxID=575653 RepID=UPI002613D61C|nr:SDR family oxidoreductase [uncultured Dokdonia sp.]
MNDFTKYSFTETEWNNCLKVLLLLKDDPFDNPDNRQFGALIAKIQKQAKKIRRKESYSQKKQRDLDIINDSVISQNALQNTTTYSVHNAPMICIEGEKASNTFTTLEIPKNCYCCNWNYIQAHFFYNRLCPICAENNYENRFKSIDLSGRHVILTGGRVKIGYATALKLLRSNAIVTVTTRFPALALAQFKEEKDYDTWKENLTLYGLDLRNLTAVETFVEEYKKQHDSLDILINNAAQTIKYTDSYYGPLIAEEKKQLTLLEGTKWGIPNATPITGHTLLENDAHQGFVSLNRFGQPIDNRTKTSWNSTLEEVSMVELLEVNLINQISPYFLIKELTPLLKASTFDKKFIINVTSSEGIFSYNNKTIYHPHTNMTKASLNMLTRTSGKEYETYGIYMNAVDVGWISTGAKEKLRKKQFEKGYIPPLDPVDGAARIMVPIIEGIQNTHNPVGTLLKNYKVVNW